MSVRLVSPIPGAAYSSSGFGPRAPIDTDGDGSFDTGNFHYGQDIVVPANTPIRAAGAGVVIAAGRIGTYGYAVYISHGHGIVTRYAHMVAHPPVSVGWHVDSGDVIGYVGSTGASTGAHLHFEVVINGIRVNPLDCINTDPPSRKDHNMARLLNLRDTINGRDPATPTRFFDGGPGIGIRGIQSPADENMLARYVNDSPGTFLNPGEIYRLNQVYLAPLPSSVDVEAAVRRALASVGGSADTAAIVHAVEAALRDDFAAIPAETVAALGSKLK